MSLNFSNSRQIFVLRFSISILLLIWIVLFISPCLNLTLLKSFYPFSKIFYSTVCHQEETKSFACNNITFLVCARCTGIYFGALLSSIVVLSKKRIEQINFNQQVLFSLPMLMDVILYSVGFYDYNKIIAASTGFLFGSTIFLYILNNVEYLFFTKKNIK